LDQRFNWSCQKRRNYLLYHAGKCWYQNCIEINWWQYLELSSKNKKSI